MGRPRESAQQTQKIRDYAPPPPEDLVIEADGDTLHIRGDVDLHHAPTLRQAAEPHVRSAPHPRLDMTEVPFLDSAGLAVLLALSRQARAADKELRLVVTGSPRRVLRITGIDRMLTVED